jgi:hypothetical protein
MIRKSRHLHGTLPDKYSMDECSILIMCHELFFHCYREWIADFGFSHLKNLPCAISVTDTMYDENAPPKIIE